MPEAHEDSDCVATPVPTLVLGAFGFSYTLLSYLHILQFVIFFLIHWHQKLFLLSWVHYECTGFFQTQICGGGPLEENL